MTKNKLSPIIAIIGPTASGKSDLGIKIAQKLGGEIISADSRQVYCGMDIGTGKVPRDRIKIHDLRFKNGDSNSGFINRKSYISNGVKHHLIDVASPKKQFTVSDFKKLGEKAITNILAREKIPIIVGGTGFYIDILLGRMAVAQVPPDKQLRAELEKQSAEQLFKRFSRMDPKYAKIIDRHNKRRLIRALEIVITTGKPIPVPALNTKYLILNTRYKVLWLGLKPKDLGERIGRRLDQRLKQGMIKEVTKLHSQGVSWKRLDDFGLEYRWISRYLQKKISYKEMRENLLKDIIKYSKRQMTWFKRNKEIRWIEDTKTAERLARRFID